MSAEVDLTHEIVKGLNRIPGVCCWRRNVGRRGGVQFGKAGQADIEGLLSPHGRRIEFEVKIDAKVTDEQRAWLALMDKHGALTGVIHSLSEALDLILPALNCAK